jgi:hypothetical protein
MPAAKAQNWVVEPKEKKKKKKKKSIGSTEPGSIGSSKTIYVFLDIPFLDRYLNFKISI